MRTSIKRFAVASSVLGVATVAGCIHPWDEFIALDQSASVWSVSTSAPGPGFGEILLGYETPTGVSPTRGTRLYVGGNSTDLGVATFATFAITDESRTPGAPSESEAELTAKFRDNLVASPIFTGCTNLDRDDGRLRCGAGMRAAAAVPVVHTTTGDFLGCVLVTTGAALRGATTAEDGFQLQCELGASGRSSNFSLAQGLGWGASAVGIPRVHEMGVAVLGAPLTRRNAGAIFVLRHIRDSGAGPTVPYAGQDLGGGQLKDELTISGLTLQAEDRLGSAMAIVRPETSTEASPFRLAASFGSGASRRVVVIDVSWDASSGTSSQVVGCLSGEGAGFGSQLAFGDFNGDGVDDLAVGAVDRNVVAGESVVSIFDGNTFTAGSCGGGAPASIAARAIGCQPSDPVDCTNSQFGYSLASGDLDGDGVDDLVVGAPRADTDGYVDGGLVQTIPGVSSLTSMGEGQRGSLTAGGVESLLGLAVTTIPSVVTLTGSPARRTVRSDIAASRAVPQATFVFLCSGFPGDVPGMLDAPMDARTEFGCGLIQDHASGAPTSSNLDPALHP